MEFYEYYGWPAYWSGENLWGPWTMPGMAAAASATIPPPVPVPGPAAAGPAHEQESHLRSMNEVRGYSIHASDGDIGRVEDFLVQDLNWSIQYILVNTSSWLSGDRVLLTPGKIKHVDWAERRLAVKVDRAAIKSGPRYDPNHLPDADPWVNDALQQ